MSWFKPNKLTELDPPRGSGRSWRSRELWLLHLKSLQGEYWRCVKNGWKIGRHDASNAGQWVAFCEAAGCDLEVNAETLETAT